MKVFERLADALIAEAAGPLFGVMGDANMLFWAELARRGHPVCSARHEAVGVGMADGYARTTGDVGIASVTCGPGVTQTGTSIVAAVRNPTPLVVLTGERPLRNRDTLQHMNHRAFVEACGAEFHSISHPDNLAWEVANAFLVARTRQRVVVLNVPMEFQDLVPQASWRYVPSLQFAEPEPQLPEDGVLDRVAAMLVSSRRPVLVAGAGAKRAGARTEALALAERIGALVSTTLLAKGWFAGEAWDVGIAGGFASGVAEKLFAEADLVLAVGAGFGPRTHENGELFPAARTIKIDSRPRAELAGTVVPFHVRGDALHTLRALDRHLSAQDFRQAGFRTASTRERLEQSAPAIKPTADGLDPRLLISHLSNVVPKDAVVTCGSGHFMAFVAQYLALGQGNTYHSTHQFGAVGQGLAIAMGASVGSRGRPGIFIEGDGGLLMYLQELETAARYRMPIVLIICNDGGFGAEFHKLRARQMDPATAQWESPDFVAIARSLGCGATSLSSEQEIESAVQQGLAAGGPFVIDARISRSLMNNRYTRLYPHRGSEGPHLRPHSS